MTQLSKLQIRAKILSVISEIKVLQYKNEEEMLKLCAELDEIEDKKSMFDMFLKEYIKLDEEDYIFCACLFKNTVPVDYITEKSLEMLKSQNLSDEYKYKIVQLLRVTGGDYDYNELPEYFENPQEVMDLETKRLLDSAVFNPESMLDFLDFVSAVSESDKSLLLQSLHLDYEGDVLANIVYPVLYADFGEEFILQAIDVLAESKSSLAIAPFEYLIEVNSSEKIINECKLGLKKLKLAGATKEKADEYFKNIVKTSVPAKYYVTIPDGSSKQALLTSRKHEDGKYSLAAVVISDVEGIVDCFGFFKISEDEIIKVINKFCNSEGRYVAPKEYVKSRIDFATKLTIKNKLPFPYEFVCWSPMISDIESLNYNIEDYVNKNCKMQFMQKQQAVDLMSMEYTLRWFLTPSESSVIRKINDEIYSNETLDIKQINEMLKTQTDNVFDEPVLNIWKDRLYNLIYILIHNNKIDEANEFFTIMNDENLFRLFKQILVQRSVINNNVAVKENTKDSIFTTNIFRKRNSNETKYNVKRLNAIIDMLKRGWLER